MPNVDRYFGPPGPCVYLPNMIQRMEFIIAPEATVEEYSDAMHVGWRRFGETLYRPSCYGCRACQAIRIDALRFRPDRSQRRAAKANQGVTTLEIGTPELTAEKRALHRAFHDFQQVDKGWPATNDDPELYIDAFVNNPYPTEEWCYRQDGRLVGVGYVDPLPDGLSGIYFFHDPTRREFSLGTWNVLSLIAETAERGLPHTYLGYYVEGCRSLEYKARFLPNEILLQHQIWVAFLGPAAPGTIDLREMPDLG